MRGSENFVRFPVPTKVAVHSCQIFTCGSILLNKCFTSSTGHKLAVELTVLFFKVRFAVCGSKLVVPNHDPRLEPQVHSSAV